MMPDKVKLRELCHARSGNKADAVNVGIAVYESKYYPWLKEILTADAVAEHLKAITPGPVRRWEMPKVSALNFYILNVSEGGYSATARLDGLAKCVSSMVLDMDVEPPAGFVPRSFLKGASPRCKVPIKDWELSRARYKSKGKTARVGCGAGFNFDNLLSNIALAESGEVDYLAFDNMTEGLGFGTLRMMKGETVWDPHTGLHFSPSEERMRAILPACAKNKVKLITNMGAADPYGTAVWVKKLCREIGVPQLRVFTVLGDDVFNTVKAMDPVVFETGKPLSKLKSNVISAHGYMTVWPVVECLKRGADIVICGRIGDGTMFLAPMIYELGWKPDQIDLLAKGQGIGHIMECGPQCTGGYFADPPFKVVEDLEHVGLPMAIVEENGDAIVTKLPGSGGAVNRLTILEQLYYEIDNPADYKHTDVTIDFTTTELAEVGPDAVRVTGTTGHPKPPTVLVCMNAVEGYLGVGGISYGGGGALERTQLAIETVKGRMRAIGIDGSRARFDMEGINTLFPWKGVTAPPPEIRLRASGIFNTQHEAQMFQVLVHELSCNGPGAGGGLALFVGGGGIEERLVLYRTTIPQEALKPQIVEV
jgi:hypothetical protein